MIVKVNRIITKNEVQQLLSEGVDVIGISLKLTDKNKDSRALTLNEIRNIQDEISIPNLSLNLNMDEFRKEDINHVIKTLEPNSLNLFIEASSLRDPSKLSKEYLSTIKEINETKLDLISFGNGFSYDGPSNIPDTLGVYENLKYQEINIETLGPKSPCRIKNKKEWSKLLNVETIKQSEFAGTILESITESMQNRPYLVDDQNIDTVCVEQLVEIGSKGITMSLCSLSQNENIPISNRIASMFEFEKIIEITKRIKKYGA